MPNIDDDQSSNPIIFRAAITSILQRLVDLVNLHFISMICPAMMRNT